MQVKLELLEHCNLLHTVGTVTDSVGTVVSIAGGMYTTFETGPVGVVQMSDGTYINSWASSPSSQTRLCMNSSAMVSIHMMCAHMN